jgi:hypothetical protein
MANEISLSVSMSAAKGGANESVSASTAITMINEDMNSATMVAPINTDVTGTLIPVGSCVNGGLMFIKNLSTDTTVTVDVAIQRDSTALIAGTGANVSFSGAKILSVGAGEVAVFRTIVGLTIYPLYRVRSSSATVTPFIQVTVLEP